MKTDPSAPIDLLKELKGVVATIRRHLDTVETDMDQLESIRMITYFANKVIFHMTHQDAKWDTRMLEHNKKVMSIGACLPPDRIHEAYDDAVNLFVDVRDFLERL